MVSSPRVGSSSPSRPRNAFWLEPGILLAYSPREQVPDAIRGFYGAIEDALSETSGPFVLITDTRDLRQMPDAIARRLHGDIAMQIMVRYSDRRRASIAIVENAVVRATVTAVRWLLGENRVPSILVANLDEALDIARRTLSN